MNPTLYDILGVRPDATPDEIKRAWRDAADRFEPGSGSSGAQFRLFNEAAEVLLDPARRREYDAQLAAEGRGPADGTAQPAQETAAQRQPAKAEPVGQPEAPVAAEAAETAAPETAAPETAAPEPPAAGTSTGTAETTETTAGRSAPSLALLVGLGVLALVLVAVAALLGLGVWSLPTVREQDKVDQATRTAPSVAERAAAAILSYDYTSLDTDEKAAERYMTPAYAKKYAQTFDKLVRGNATNLHAKVQADVRASGVSHADADRANVLLFVNQTTTSTANEGQPQTALNRVELSMVKRDGTWLVNDITSY